MGPFAKGIVSGRTGARARRSGFLMAGTGIGGLVLSLLGTPHPAYAACTVGAASVDCADTVTTDTTNTNGAAPSSDDRHQEFDAVGAGGAVTVGVNGDVTGFGLAITNSQAAADGNIAVTNNGSVSNDPGNVPAAGGTAAFNITGSGVTVSYGGAGTVTGNGIDGLTVVNDGGGAVEVTTGGAVTGSNGVTASAVASGTATITIGADVTSTGGQGVVSTTVNGQNTVTMTGGTILSSQDGIQASASGTGGVTVDSQAGQIGAPGTPVGTIGINATQTGTAGNLSVTAGTIFSTGSGVDARVLAINIGGTLNVTANGAISAGGDGIFATSAGTGAIAIDGTGAVTGAANGINVTQTGNAVGAAGISITGTGAVAGTAGTGVNARITDANNSGTVTIDRSGPISGVAGVNAGTVGAGAVNVTTGAVTATAGPGITTSATTGQTTIITNGAVDATGGQGILSTAGAGGISVTANAGVTGSTGSAIDVSNTGAGAIAVSATAGAVTGANGGITAASTGTGGVTVTGGSAVQGSAGTGVSATATSGAVDVTYTGDISGTTGILAQTTAGGAVNVATSGLVTSTAGAGIQTVTTTGATTITAGPINSAGNGIDAQVTGASAANIVVNQNGAIVAGGHGIDAAMISAAATGAIQVNVNADITATGAGQDGVRANNAGTGAASVILANGVTVLGDPGIVVDTAGGDAIASTGDNSTVTAGVGIIARQNAAAGAGAVTVTVGQNTSVTGDGSSADPLNGIGIAAQNSGAAAATNVGIGAGATVTGTLAGIQAGAVNGTTTVTVAGGAAVSGATGVRFNSTGAGGADLTNLGTITGTGTGLEAALAAGATTAVANAGTIMGGTLAAPARAINVAGGNLAFSNNAGGVLTGFVTTAAGTTSVITNNQNATWNYGGGDSAFNGNDTINNFGLFALAGTTPRVYTLAGLETFNNQATGVLSMVNGDARDVLTIGGNYVGTGGSVIAVDVDLSATSGGRADRLVVDGTLSGTSAVAFNFVGSGPPALSGAPVIVAQGSAASTGTLTAAPIARNGFVDYTFQQVAPGTYGIVATLNTTAASQTTTAITSAISSINSGFIQPSSSFIGGPGDAAPNTWAGGAWVRVQGGQFDYRNTGTATIAGGTGISSTSGLRSTFGGFQVGLDTGLFNINGSGWNVHFGLTAGQVTADAQQRSGGAGTTKFNVPFAGVYGAVTGGRFFADILVRRDFFDMKVTNPTAGVIDRDLNGESTSVSVTGGYRFDVGTWFIEPSAALTWAETDVDPLAVTGGTLDFSTIDSLMGRAGLRIGTAFLATDNLALQPFVALSLWHEFEDSAGSSFVTQSGMASISVDRVGTFGQIGLGLSGQLLDSGIVGFVRGDVRFGDKVNGGTVNAGLRYNF